MAPTTSSTIILMIVLPVSPERMPPYSATPLFSLLLVSPSNLEAPVLSQLPAMKGEVRKK
jgi:hypothetical protein